MRIFKIYRVYLVSIVILLANGCEKPEGLGGSSSIKGKIKVHAYDNSFINLQEIYPAADENVFLRLIDDNKIIDDVSTSDEGVFEFKYLTKGTYIIVVYSDSNIDSILMNNIPVYDTVEINNNGKEVDAGEIIIYKALDFDDGKATISGTVNQVNYSNEFVFIKDTTKAQEQDIYLFYEDDKQYVERVRTNQNGYFAFHYLIKGSYKVLVYSEDTDFGTALIPVVANVEIDEINKEVNLGDIYVVKED
jgi:hypothetical protein